MKKLFSISVALLMLLSGMQFTISTHYCGGKFAESKVSLVGHIASCGMESETGECPQPGNYVKSSCCNDKISAYEIDHNYSPSFSEIKVFAQPALQFFILPEISVFYSTLVYNRFYTDVSPPVNLQASDVNLSDIGVFRI